MLAGSDLTELELSWLSFLFFKAEYTAVIEGSSAGGPLVTKVPPRNERLFLQTVLVKYTMAIK